MSLACIDELELHNPIERLAMYEIRRVVPGDRKRDLTVKAVPINDDMTIAARWITEGQMPTTLQTTITHTTLGRYRRQSGQHPGN